MSVLAVFPVRALRETISRKPGRDYSLSARFGYHRADSMRPAIWYADKNLANVHCGSVPLKGTIWSNWSNGAYPAGFHLYVDQNNQFVYPG